MQYFQKRAKGRGIVHAFVTTTAPIPADAGGAAERSATMGVHTVLVPDITIGKLPRLLNAKLGSSPTPPELRVEFPFRPPAQSE